MVSFMAIIFGAAVLKGGGASNTLRRRILTGVKIKQEGMVSKLVLSGRGGVSLPSEACVMKRIALDEGISEDDIIIDQESRTTIETVIYCSKIARAHGVTKVLIVTDRYHMYRCRLAFQAVGIEGEPIFADPRLCRSSNYAMAKSIAREAIAWITNAPKVICLYLSYKLVLAL
jgi:uncharacterized SAM-binding protein YcdF (DUF218 family)